VIESQLLAELEARLSQLTLALLKLPPGDERGDILRGIATFGQHLSNLKRVERERRKGGPIAIFDQAAPREHRQIASCPENMTALTPRERQIMRLVSEGLSNKEIGRRLNIVDGTIKVHLHNIFQKLEVRNRTVLAALAMGLPSASEPPERLKGRDG